MELSRRLFLISLGVADFVTYDQREVFSWAPNRSVPHNICSTEKILLAGN